MGQRLVIHFNTNDETIASLYYHWGGFTESSFYEIERVAASVNSIFNFKKNQNVQLIKELLEFMIDNNGSFDETSEFDYLTDNYIIPLENIGFISPLKDLAKKVEKVGNGSFLLAISPKNIKFHEAAAEADIYVDLDNHTIDMGGVFWAEDIEDYLEGFEEDERDEVKKEIESRKFIEPNKISSLNELISLDENVSSSDFFKSPYCKLLTKIV